MFTGQYEYLYKKSFLLLETRFQKMLSYFDECLNLWENLQMERNTSIQTLVIYIYFILAHR